MHPQANEPPFVSVVGDPRVTSVTGEKFDLWKTGWSPKDMQPVSVPQQLVARNVVHCGSDKCALFFLPNVLLSGSLVSALARLICGSERARDLS